MTTLQQPFWAPMDAPNLDEKMDVASSPFHQVEVEDIDLEIDPMENQTLIPPSDNIMDDASDFGSKMEDDIQGPSTELIEDQDMQDDGQGEVAAVENELDMGEEALDSHDREDELIYDAEEATATTADLKVQPQVQLEPPQVELPTEVEEEEEDMFEFDNADNADKSAPSQPLDQRTATEDSYEPAEAAIQAEPGDAAPDNPSHIPSSLSSVDDETAPAAEAPLQAASELPDQEQEQPQQQEHEQQQQQESHLNGLSVEVPQQLPQGQVNNNSHDISPVDDQILSTVESLADIDISALGPHFVSLTYKNAQYPLFSDGEAPDGQPFPLSDTNLIFEPLEKLLDACKERVFTEDQDHLDEVAFTIPVFAMKYSQDSKFASEHSLWDILRLYVKFKQNEGAKSIEPLNCTLSVQTCLDTQFRWLITEAHKKLTYSDLHPDYVGTGNTLSEPLEHAQDPSADEEHSLEGEEGEEAEEVEEVEHEEVSHDFSESAAPKTEAHDIVENAGDENARVSEEQADGYTVGADLTADAPADAPADQHTQEQSDPTLLGDTVPAEEQDADQSSDFFEEAYEDEAEEDAVENEEEQLEHVEDNRALEQTQATNELALETGLPIAAGDTEQTDVGDEPQPFKIVEEVEEIILEEEDPIINPQDPLPADHDPDAVLEGRAVDVSSAELKTSKPNDSQPKGPAATDPTPTTPSKSNSSKRKAEEDEEDIIELDFDTPQPKRPRASPP